MNNNDNNNKEKTQKKKYSNSKFILSQNSDQALADGKLNVQSFVAARSYEIRQMEAAIKRSKASSKQRAFQSLPRFLRRRAASHNVKRVPHRIREKSKKEMALDKVTKKRSVRGHERAKLMAIERRLQASHFAKSGPIDITGVNKQVENEKPLTSNSKYIKRQKERTWLPTHVWHAKRSRMIQRWGYSIAETPTQKCYRATHRVFNSASAITWDTSYFNNIVLVGVREELIAVIKNTVGPRAVKQSIISGQKSWEGIFGSFQSSHYGPVLIYFNNSDETSQVLIHMHPEIYEPIFDSIQSQQKTFKFDINDCRYSIGSIDITGSKSLSVLTSLLKSRDPDSVVNKLKGLANIDHLPSQAVFTTEVNDPRFYNPYHGSRDCKLTNDEIDWFSYIPESTSLLTIEGRRKSYENQATIKILNERRSQTKPGEPIEVAENDPIIPVVIFKRDDNSITVLLPWYWIMPFWHSLQRIDGVRFGGLDQMHQLRFEQGRPFFPNDYSGTECGLDAQMTTSNLIHSSWDRKPIAKRVNYDATKISKTETGEIGIFSKCDWEFLAESKNCSYDWLLDQLTVVRVKYLNKGRPTFGARIYRIPKNELTKWKSSIKNNDEADGLECPSSNHLIGFITTGDFNLQQGNGSGIGSIMGVPKFRGDGDKKKKKKMEKNMENLSQLVIVRNPGTNVARLAEWSVCLPEELVDANKVK